MKWASTLAAFSALVCAVVAEDLLMVDTLVGLEQDEATSLGFSVKVVTEAQWRAMGTSDFAAFKAIIIGDPFGSQDLTLIQFLSDTASTWGPAVQGNIIIHGTDQSNHDKTVLIDNSINFAVAGKSSTGSQNTGFYFSLSQYYTSIAVSNVDALSYFGTFTVEGNLNCYNQAHIVASSPAISTLTDDYLSNWSCSVHEAFSVYPSVGLQGFQAIAIADGVVAPGTQTFGDGHSGLPYILTRGATPAGCGNGIYEPSVGEECDDGKSNGALGDPCSASCKCLSGKPKGDGTCYPSNSTIPTGPSSGKPSGYSNVSIVVGPTTTPPYPVSTPINLPPYTTPTVPSLSCIGVEIIVSVTISDTVTVPCTTYQKPIYNTPISSMPCYVCALQSQGITCPGFITATTTHCAQCTGTPAPPVILPCETCSAITLTETCPWATTPAFSLQGATVYTTYSAMHESPSTVSATVVAGTSVATAAAKSPFCSTCSSITVSTTAGGVPVQPTSTGVVQFTGAAVPASGSVNAVLALVGAGFVGVVAIML